VLVFGKTTVLKPSQMTKATTQPSYVSFSENQRLIGDAAKSQVAMNVDYYFTSSIAEPVSGT
jgi:molecular chaperone DnaK (HSP70)